MTNTNKLNKSTNISEYIVFLIGTKYLKSDRINVEYFEKCQEIANKFVLSKYFNITKIDFNLKEYFYNEKVNEWEDQKKK